MSFEDETKHLTTTDHPPNIMEALKNQREETSSPEAIRAEEQQYQNHREPIRKQTDLNSKAKDLAEDIQAYDSSKGQNDPEVRSELCSHKHIETRVALGKPKSHFAAQESQTKDQQQDHKAKADTFVEKLHTKPRPLSVLSPSEVRIHEKGNEFLVPPEKLVPEDLVGLVGEEIQIRKVSKLTKRIKTKLNKAAEPIGDGERRLSQITAAQLNIQKNFGSQQTVAPSEISSQDEPSS